MFDFVSVEPAFENCTLVEQIFEAIDLAGLIVRKMKISSSKTFTIDFFGTSIYLACSTQDSYETISVNIILDNEKLDDMSISSYEDSDILCERLTHYTI